MNLYTYREQIHYFCRYAINLRTFYSIGSYIWICTDEEREHLYLTFQSTLLEMQHTVPPVAYYHCFYFSGFFS